MKLKITKGEWIVSDNKINSPVRHIVKMPRSKPTKYNGTMYACIGGFDSETQTEEAEANAHLIAAAPDMYKALEAMSKGEGLQPGTTIESILLKARGE